jgi:hypothetical protein
MNLSTLENKRKGNDMNVQNSNGTYTSPKALCDATKNTLLELAQIEANQLKKPHYIWIWSVKSPYECSYAICPADDEEAIYSQDPSNHLLSTVYPIPNPIHPPIRNSQ